MPNPPTPRRCRRILEAHHLDCQARPSELIAEQLHRVSPSASGLKRF